MRHSLCCPKLNPLPRREDGAATTQYGLCRLEKPARACVSFLTFYPGPLQTYAERRECARHQLPQ